MSAQLEVVRLEVDVLSENCTPLVAVVTQDSEPILMLWYPDEHPDELWIAEPGDGLGLVGRVDHTLELALDLCFPGIVEVVRMALGHDSQGGGDAA